MDYQFSASENNRKHIDKIENEMDKYHYFIRLISQDIVESFKKHSHLIGMDFESDLKSKITFLKMQNDAAMKELNRLRKERDNWRESK